ncbi:MAG: hypothetical protein SGI88_01255 [Candidatus Hydrogenedentes bacterium]|nr:hypothetical protein [Candidatus Hydrogenedentota bacterium]
MTRYTPHWFSLLFQRRVLRAVAWAAVAFLAAAEGHEALLGPHHAAAHADAESHQSHETNHECALCVLAGTPALVTAHHYVPAPPADEHRYHLALQLSPPVRDTSCFTHLRRGPPSL